MTLTVTAVQGSTLWPSVQLTVSSSPSVSGLIEVYRTHADGARYQVLTDSHSTLVGSWVGSDLHAPFNQSVTYTAEAAGQVSAASAPVFLLSGVLWLIHPTDPELSVLADKWMAQATPYKYAGRAEMSLVLNSRLPRARASSPRAGESGTMRIKCETPDSRAAVKALFADGGPILINTQFTDDEIGWKWVLPGDLDMDNPAGTNRFPFRYASFTYEQVTQPDADVRVRTFDELEADFPGASFDDLDVTYASFDDLELDIRQP